MTRIVRFHSTGDADVLQLEQVPLAAPGEGEVRLKVEAIGLNRAEILFRQGLYLESPNPPSRIGYEAAGVVDAVGPGVDRVKIGDRVSTIPSFAMGTHGVYGESAIVPAHAAAAYPDNLSAVEGAAIWMQYLTAYGALIAIAGMTPRQTVLITAASSSVGLAAIQIVKKIGARAVATTRGPSKKSFLLEAGADHVIVTDEEDLAMRTRELTGGSGADIIFDPVAGPFLEKLAQAAAPGAFIFAYGALSLAPTPYPLFDAIGKGLTIRGYNLSEIVRQPDTLAAGKQFVREGLTSGELKPVIDSTFSLDEIEAAHRHMEANQQQGKIVVTV
ncbi:MAG: zinc-dependent alcohol dehydrogenase family protein [Desulfobacterales bacterium]|nr:zinc-dependent alcohol dehydrogenase family protein [Desulfobacterales bacterium]